MKRTIIEVFGDNSGSRTLCNPEESLLKKRTAIHKAVRGNRKKGTAICKLLILAAVFGVFVGCSLNEKYFHVSEEHTGTGVVKVTTDWTGRSSDAILPSGYVLRVGDEERDVYKETNTFAALPVPSRRPLLVYNRAEGFTFSFSGGVATATVKPLPDGTLEPLPGYLFATARELEIVGNDTLRITVPMKQYVRRLTLILNPVPGDETRIDRIGATLSGVASAIGLSGGGIATGSGKTVVPVFERGTDGRTAFSATLRLLGTSAAERQTLTLVLTLRDGTSRTVVNDLTEKLRNFVTAGMEPLTLSATLDLSAAAEVGFTTIIDEWTPGNTEAGEVW